MGVDTNRHHTVLWTYLPRQDESHCVRNLEAAIIADVAEDVWDLRAFERLGCYIQYC